MDKTEDRKDLKQTLITGIILCLIVGTIILLVQSIFGWIFNIYNDIHDYFVYIFAENPYWIVIVFVFLWYTLDSLLEYYIWKPLLRKSFTNRKGYTSNLSVTRRTIQSLTRNVNSTLEKSPELGHLTWVVSVLENINYFGYFGRRNCGLSVLSMRKLILKFPINHVVDNLSVLDIVEGSHLKVLKVVCHKCRKPEIIHWNSENEGDRKKYCQCEGLDEIENWFPDEQIYIESGYSLSDIDMNYVRMCIDSGGYTKQEAVDSYIKKLNDEKNNNKFSSHRL